MLNFKAKIFIFVGLLFVCDQLLAARVTALYDVGILVADESAEKRWGALKKGLDEVFIRISGDSIVMDKIKRPPSSRFVKQFSYEPVENPGTNDMGETLNYRLKIQYNESLMKKYLQENGFPVWGEHRPDVVVWLAVRDGTNEYVLKDADKSLLKTAVDDALVRRGVPERWPLYDYKDRKIVTTADIRGGFKDPVTKASNRYSRGPALAGSMTWNGQQWQSNWSLLMSSGDQYWSLVDSDYEHIINKSIDQAADAMGSVFAVHGAAKNQILAKIQLDIQSVNSINKYHHVENYLTKLSAVEEVKPLKIDGSNAVFEVTLRSNEEDFLNLIHNDAELIEAKAIATEPDPGAQLIPDSNQITDNEKVKVDAENVSDSTIQQHQIPVYHYKFIK